MDIDAGDIAGIIAGYKAGQYTQTKAKQLLREAGADDDIITDLLSLGAGIVVGGLVGNVVEDLFDSLF